MKKGEILIKLWDDDVKAEIQMVEAKLFTDTKILNRIKALVKIGGVLIQDYE